jgi:DNA invertase Pin-like site-specific DNA recombinase
MGDGAERAYPSNQFGRLMDQISKGVAGFFRQSSMLQARENLGSQSVQEDSLRWLKPFGVREEDVKVVLAYGESGRPGVVREKFRELERMIERDQVGLVVLARHDRLGRSEADATRVFNVMAERGTLMMVDGRIYDPADEGDAFILKIYAQFAEYENRARVRWMMMSRFAKAQRLSERIKLPSGLIWASPEDPEYVGRLHAAGLIHWLDDLDRHRAVSHRNGQRYYILPYPDADVSRSVELRLRWILEMRSLSGVLYRIRDDPEWPRPGKVPMLPTHFRFDPHVTPVWKLVRRAYLHQWFLLPALYGTYAFSAPALAPAYARLRRKSA